MFTLARLILSLSVLSAHAHASLYPTRPVANTVYEADQQAQLLWIDDGSSPRLDELPKLQLELYAPDNTLIKIFDKHLDPNAKKYNVTLSPTLGVNSSGYYFRFHSDKPEHDYYTARFTINGLTGSSSSTSGEPVVAGAAVGSSNLTTPRPAGSAGGPAPATFNIGPSAPLHTGENLIPTALPQSNSPATLVSHTTISAGSWSSQNSARGNGKRFGDFDFEAFKFRIVFILWPAMMGISLAL